MKLWKSPALPAAPQAWTSARQRASREWQRLAPREQRLVSLAALVAGAALLWMLAFEPAWNSVQTLRDRLPQLRAQSAQLDTILTEIRELQAGTTSGALPVAEVPAALEDSLRRAGLDATATVSQATPDTWDVHLNEAPVSPVLQWLQTLPYELRLATPQVELARAENAEGRQLAGRLTGRIVVAFPNEGGA